MALRGTLIDISIVDLVQLPNRGRKTGELIVVGTNDEARLYYEKGNLVHALIGEVKGLEVLVDVLDWQEGEFEFRLDINADEHTIDMDLHRAVMVALKLRDERKAEEARLQQLEEEAIAQGNSFFNPKYSPLFSDFISSTSFIKYICILTQEGELLAESRNPEDPPDSEQLPLLQGFFHTFVHDYPRPKLDRLMVTDSGGSIVVSTLQTNETILVLSTQDAPMGAVSRSVQKLVSAIQEG